MPGRSELGAELKRRFAEQGHSMCSAAQHLGLVENSLRSWIRRNGFPAPVLEKLAKFAGLPRDVRVLQRQYDFEVVGAKRTPRRRVEELLDSPGIALTDALALFDARLPEMEKVCGSFEQDIRLVFRALGAQDLYICQCLDQVPYELEGTGWSLVGRDMARAVEAGAVFVYVYPEAQLAAHIAQAGLHRVLAPESFERMLEVARERIRRLKPKLKRGTVEHRVLGLACSQGVFMVPGHQYLLLHSRTAPGTAPRLLARVPAGGGSQVSAVLAPLADEAASAFVSVAIGLLEGSPHAELARHFY